MADGKELEAWLSLNPRAGLSAAAVRRLLAAFGSPQAVLDAGPGAWREVGGADAAKALAQPSDLAQQIVEQGLHWQAHTPGAQVIALGEAAYPPALFQTADPPFLLFCRGRVALLQQPSLAVVGSRHATAQGIEHARAFSHYLSDAGLCIVSGLAAGIDGAAHEGGLRGRGSTIAVMGTGPEQLYPRRHQGLGERIAQEGLLLTEFAPGTPPLPANFPQRNRIIAGLSLGTLVVEAAVQSGSLITARLASECGREVFAIPGSIHSPVAKGCHRLIQQGAKLVETGEDVLQELRAQTALLGPRSQPEAKPLPPSREEPPVSDPVLAALGQDPMSLDSLVARTGWPASVLSAKLLELELSGLVARLPGGFFQRCGQA
ncbi:MAG: DNA-protecting protein DprA [Ideonella sp. MAG2]|nr:MAG: DNA-protecting protein DprA [Ideonella sp. MAG2]